MQRKKLDLTRRLRERARALGADRLRRAAAATGMDRRDIDDAARRAHFGI